MSKFSLAQISGRYSMRNGEIHFYVAPKLFDYFGLHITYDGTLLALVKGKKIIKTTQMAVLSTRLFDMGYRIFIHEGMCDVYEIKLGTENERTNRDIRMGHNLYILWVAGEFAKE